MEDKGKITLDLKDRKLLYQLDLDARQNYSQLAKKIGVSKQVIGYRIERLEKQGVLKGYYAMIDSSKLGYTSVRVYIKCRYIQHKARKELVSFLQKQKAVFAVAHIAGTWDLAFLLNVKDIQEFYTYWDSLLEKFLEYILDYNISIYSPVYHFSKAYLVGKEDKTPIRMLGGQKKEEVDKKDLLILQELSKNARVSLVELSQKIKQTAEAAHYRIKRLQKKGIIQGYRALIDIKKLGMVFYKVDIRLRSVKNFKSLLCYCHMQPHIYQMNRTIGGETLEIEFQVRDIEHLREEMETMEKAFPNTIEYYSYYNIFEELKVKYMPEV